jgi:hypothetical protein
MFEFFKENKNKQLFSQQYLGKLIDTPKPHIECCKNDEVVPLDMITLIVLEERKLFIPFKKWRTIQSSNFPVVQNIFWHICSTSELTHHELRDGINEVNANLKAQGNELECFLEHATENGRSLFYLYSFNIGDLKFFNASVLILNKDFDFFEFDEFGNCKHKKL